jgi:HSP20 family protein
MENNLTNNLSIKNEESEPEEIRQNEPYNTYRKTSRRAPAWRPPTDVFESEQDILVRVEIAGMRENDFVIELNGNHLVIRGNRQDIIEKKAFHQMEIRFGEFILELDLSIPINSEEVDAIYQNGFLLIRLPKASPHQIPIGK